MVPFKAHRDAFYSPHVPINRRDPQKKAKMNQPFSGQINSFLLNDCWIVLDAFTFHFILSLDVSIEFYPNFDKMMKKNVVLAFHPVVTNSSIKDSEKTWR